jgi:dolichyldiphosphatase
LCFPTLGPTLATARLPPQPHCCCRRRWRTAATTAAGADPTACRSAGCQQRPLALFRQLAPWRLEAFGLTTMGVRPLQEAEKLLSLTAVVYTRGDRLGQALAATSMLPLVLVVSLVTCVLCRRDLHTCFILLGQLLNELFNKALKETVREARPEGAPADDFGMPSSHSQFMWFFAAYHLQFVRSRAAQHSRWEVLGSSALAVSCAAAVAYSRVYLRYHTVEQVIIGGLLGVACGTAWRGATVKWFAPSLFPALEQTRIAAAFHFHDASHVDNVFASAAAAARNARAAAAAAQAGKAT